MYYHYCTVTFHMLSFILKFTFSFTKWLDFLNGAVVILFVSAV